MSDFKMNTFRPGVLASVVTEVITAGLVPYITSSPGVGKSAITASVAEDYNLELIDIRLSQLDPTELNGFPSLDVVPDTKGTRKVASYIPMDVFPLENTPLPKGKDGWLLFLDELSSAPPAVQAAAYKLILDRKVGTHNLHPNVAVVAAGNDTSHSAVAFKMGTAIRSRLVHLNLVSNFNDWSDWATSAGIDHRIVDFLAFRPELLNKFDPQLADDTFPCERTWEFVSRLTKKKTSIRDSVPLLAGTVGQGAAQEFSAFVEIYSQLATINEIVTSPTTARVATEPAALWATAGMVAEHVTAATFGASLAYLQRIPPEFMIVAMKRLLSKDKTFFQRPEYAQWLQANGHLMRSVA